MLKIKTKFKWVIAAYMFIPISGMILFAYDTPMYHTPEFQGILGVSVAAAALLAFCNPFPFGLRWLLLSQLAEISSAISRIKTGNYTYFTLPNEPSETGDENEAVALMRDMNWMIRQIEYRETELEDRVSQRTRELERANAELIQARDAANASARAKSEFLATMSHEIRTPMNAVIGMSDLALNANRDPGQQEYLSAINTASKSLLKIINDILDFSKMDAGKLVLEAIPVRLRDLMDEAADLFRAQVREVPVEFILDISPNVPDTVRSDPLRLRQVVVNLLSNAFKFTEQGEVCLSVKPAGEGRFCFSIRDTGMGMDEQTRKGLFTAFNQADGSTTRKFGGTGLGLAISRKLVRLMGSEITVDSTPGRGSCFSFTIKLEDCGSIRSSQAPLPSDLSGRQVIVTIPHRTSRKIIMTFLTDFGLIPRAVDPNADAPGGGKNTGSPLLAIVDADLPDPARVAAALKTTPDLSVIAVGSARSLTRGATPPWADRLLLKPVKQSLLFDSIMDLCLPECFLSASWTLPECASGHRVPEILLVEDNKMNQKVAVEILKTAGITPVLASGGERALHLLGTRAFDAVLMDVQMPDMDGYAVTREIRDRGFQTKVIGMSANAMDRDRQQGIEAGMDAYLTKPVDAAVLFDTLEACIQKPIRAEQDAKTPFEGRTDSLPGIDMAAALDRIRGNKKLLTELILEFTRDQAGLMETLDSLTRNGEGQDMLTLLHQVKGNAGNIGATGLATALADCETLVKETDEPDTSTLVPALARCREELARVMDAGRILGQKPREEKFPAAPETVLSPRLPEMMAELRELLDQHSLRAKEFSKEIAEALAGTPCQQDAVLLRAQTGRFDFAAAGKTVNRIRSALDLPQLDSRP